MKPFKYLNSLKKTTFCTHIHDEHIGKWWSKEFFGSCFLLSPKEKEKEKKPESSVCFTLERTGLFKVEIHIVFWSRRCTKINVRIFYTCTATCLK